MAGPAESADFEALYDLPDPRPYYRGLEPSGYRLPDVLAGFLAAAAPAIRAGRGRPETATLRLLDFACGYGAVGLLLQHELSMAELYAHYRETEAGAEPGGADAAAFAARRRPARDYAVGGLDVAGAAVRYAESAGAVKAGFTDDLAAGPPGPALALFLEACDVVVEAGAVGGLLAPAFARLTEATATVRPWVLFCPRPNVDPAPATAVLADAGYRVEPLGAPVAYRKPLSDGEHAQVLAGGRALGLADGEILDDSGFMRVQMRLARPADQADSPSISELSGFIPGT